MSGIISAADCGTEWQGGGICTWHNKISKTPRPCSMGGTLPTDRIAAECVSN